jgi:hypothetical protein
MKLSVLAILFFLSLAFLYYTDREISSDEDRFVISINGKKGFINNLGEIVIRPQFQDALEFSEGLCAVRIEGRYGFINTQGELRIPAIYDYATIFKEGTAVVYMDGKPRFITQDGRIAFNSNYQHISHFENGLAEVRTYSGKTGILNRQGVLIIDTIYSQIDRSDDGFAVVYGPDHREYETANQKENPQVSVIDISGKMLFPYGKFKSIEDYNEGYFLVNFSERKGGNIAIDAIVNKQGEVLFSLPNNEESWINGNVHDGIIRVSLPVNKRSSEYHDAYVNLTGHVVYSNNETFYGTDFKDNVAFVGDKNFMYSIINRRGEVISKEKFGIPCCSFANPFENGRAVVEFNDDTWGVIDTTARVLLKTTYKHIHPEHLIDGQYLFFQGKGNDSEGSRYGLINLQGKVLISPILQDFDRRGFVNNLLKAVVDNKVAYFTRDGQKIWQDIIDEKRDLSPLNIDYMNRGYFYANYDYTGHPGESRHVEPKEVTDENTFSKNSLSIVADPGDDDVDFFQVARGMRVYVANTTTDTVTFNAQDNRLYMKMQARDKDENWRDIEYLPSSWCGNSYHTVELAPQRYWTFVAPVYDGAIATKMRIALTYVDRSNMRDLSQARRRHYRDAPQLTIYSNEFTGIINPAQFWRRPEYTPSGIMDPYNE